MEHSFTQEELREALLAALIDYEGVKKTRRIKAVKKTLQGTMMATLLGSTGLMAAGQGRTAPEREAAVLSAGAVPVLDDFPREAGHSRFIPGAAHFGLNKHTLAASQEARLLALAKELPPQAEVSVIGRTDATGSKRHNQRLGLQRAQAAADFLAMHGVKVKAIGSKVSNYMPENWMQRRVDIVVDQAFTPGTAAHAYAPPVAPHHEPVPQAHAPTPRKPAPQVQAQPVPQPPVAAAMPSHTVDVAKPYPIQPPPPKHTGIATVPSAPLVHDTLGYQRHAPVSEHALESAVPPTPPPPVAQPKTTPPAARDSFAAPAETPAAAVMPPPKPVARKPAPAVSNIAITDTSPPVNSAPKAAKRAAPLAVPPGVGSDAQGLGGGSPDDSLITHAKPVQSGLQRQVIRGATHFAANSYALAWANKERLMELVRQLPKDAELTVVGRTESNGAEDSDADLGKLRAVTVATFLTNFGVKVKAVGSKQSSDRFTGWGARRVDIVVDSAPTPKRINLPQATQQQQPAEQKTPYLYKVD